jgi:acyl-CoA synthetase (AMP-forming)/AMP-acid ligase II
MQSAPVSPEGRRRVNRRQEISWASGFSAPDGGARLARRGLLDWVEDPSATRGLHFLEHGDRWGFWPYSRVASLATMVARQIESLGARRGSVIFIMMKSAPEFAGALVGSLLAGNTPSPISLPRQGYNRARQVDHVAEVLRAADPALILTDHGALYDFMKDAVLRARVNTAVETVEVDTPVRDGPRRRPADLALLQFTSGSSSRPVGVRITWSNLEANVAMIRAWLEIGPGDQTATWLPLHHDMGLIGCLVTPMVTQTDVWIMRPEQFVADPERWIECFGLRGVQLGVAPTFGYGYAARRVSDEAIAHMDFSAWRAAIVGAERVDASVLSRFGKHFAPRGFRPAAFLPAYGLAEATLAVTGVALNVDPRVVRPDWSSSRFGHKITIVDKGRLAANDRVDAGNGWVISCGCPQPGVSVSVVDDDGRELPQGHLGEIAIQSETVAAGYSSDAEGRSTRFDGDRLYTGDAGFILGGELFVIGRLGDSVKIRGRTVFVEELEALLYGIGGVEGRKCVVLAGTVGVQARVVVISEMRQGPWVEAAVRIVSTEIGGEAQLLVVAAPSGSIKRTSSGKPRRRQMWADISAAPVKATVVYDSATAI